MHTRWCFTFGWIATCAACWLLTSSAVQAADGVLAPIPERFAPQAGKAMDEVPSFQRHVSPLLGRLGCNGRACHGSFQGRGGFQLSLFGYDFVADHKALTGGDKPRVNLQQPAESLILNKPTSEDNHEGGERYKKEGWEYQVLSRWIQAGAKDDSEQHPKLQRLEIIPAEVEFTADGSQKQLQAIAHWADGSKEDVTPLCRFKSNDTEVAGVDEAGQVSSQGLGDTHIIVFYDNGVVPVPVLRPISAETVAAYPAVSTPTRIDELVVAKLRRLGIVPAETCSDSEFLRRVSLDLTGTLPASQEVLDFLADTSPDKRARKVDELLERPGYAAWFTTRLCDLTGNNPKNGANNAFRDVECRQWYDWIYQRVQRNAPYDEIIAGIVEANGRLDGQSLEDYCKEMTSYVSPNSTGSFADRDSMPHYWSRRNTRKPEEKALSFAHAFLGVRLECAQCHKHPFDQWSKKDFEQFTSFFAGIQYGTPNADKAEYKKLQESLNLAGKKGNELQKMLPQMAKEGKVVPFQEVYVSLKMPGNNNKKKKDEKKADEPVFALDKARVLGGDLMSFKSDEDPRTALMDWMRKSENPYFARAIVNRVWAGYFNVGIIEPPDDLSLGNPPSNAPLLDWLTQEFIAHKFDLKWLHKTIVLSSTYQASWKTNATNELDTRNFSHAVPRRLPAEVAADAMRQATLTDSEVADWLTGVTQRSIGAGGTTYKQGNGKPNVSYVLAAFGKPARETNCDCERSSDPSLLQTLYLRNDREMLSLIDRRGGWLESIAKQYKLPFMGSELPLQERQKKNKPVAAETLKPEMKVPSALTTKLVQLQFQLEKANKQKAKAQKKNNKELLAKTEERLQSLKDSVKEVKQEIAALQKQASEKPGEAIVKPETTAASETKSSAPTTTPADAGKVLPPAVQSELVRTAYLRTLSRLPNADEEARAVAYLRDAKQPMDGLRDVLWAVLNTKEFIINH